MIELIVVVVLAVAGLAGTGLALRSDGYRRTPTLRI